MKEIKSCVIPNKFWFNLKEACELKGLNYKTAGNNRRFQPNGGVRDGKVGGRNVWKRDTIIKWLEQTDDKLMND